MKNLERIIKLEPGFDCIRFECKFNSDKCKPGEGGSHGRAGLDIRFVVKGKKGAIQFLLYTGWLPQKTEPSGIGTRWIEKWSRTEVLPADLGCHSKKPLYEGQEIVSDSCEYCDGKPCYYDGSGLQASNAMYTLVNGGGEALWQFLEEYYNATFEGSPYPEPAEYPMKLREEG